MKIRSTLIAAVCGSALSLPGMIQAQQDQPNSNRPQQPGVQVNIGRHGEHQISDQALATCLAIENQEEVAISKFAEDKAKSQKVKEFAAMIAKDHRSFLQKLEKYAPEATGDNYFHESADHQNARGEAGRAKPDVKVEAAGGAVKATTNNRVEQTAGRENRTEARDGKGNDAAHGNHTDHTSMLQLHREFAQQCLNDTKQNLGKKEGAEFDECFMGLQIAKHAGMKAKLTVIERHVSGDLKQVVSEGLKTTEKHLQKAEEIMKQLNHDSSTASTK